MTVPISGHTGLTSGIASGNINPNPKTWASLPMTAGYWGIPGHGLANPN